MKIKLKAKAKAKKYTVAVISRQKWKRQQVVMIEKLEEVATVELN